jgi:hypothetical protein
MATEAWWRNPRLYIRELVEVGVGNLIFDMGVIAKHRMNVHEFVHAHYGQAIPYRLIILGNMTAAEYAPEKKKPIAVYPVWHFGEDTGLLEEMLQDPVGQNKEACFDLDTPVEERPVYDQEHRVIITNLPDSKMPQGRRLLAYLRDLQDTFPKAIIHLHGVFSYKVAFGYGLGAADVNPRDWAAHGQVALPGGSVVNVEKVQAHATWITAMGMTPGDLAVPRNRCIYNIKSGEWAAKNFLELTRFRTRPSKAPVDTVTPDREYRVPAPRNVLHGRLKVKEGDKVLCSMCSLAPNCSYFRDQAVCSLPDADPTPLANFFKTRDAQSIIDGLSVVVAFNARRLERGAETEEALDDIDPEVTKLAGVVFDQGVKLAKLLDPSLRGAAVKINLNTPGSQAAVAGMTPQELTSGIIRALEHQGIPRDKITPEMVKGMLEGMANPQGAQAAIEGQTVNRDDVR